MGDSGRENARFSFTGEIFELNGGFSKRKCVMLGLNGGLLKRKRAIFGLNSNF